MVSVPTFIGITKTDENIAKQIWKTFENTLEAVQRKKRVMKYPNRRFKVMGIPSPRQYIAWDNLIKKIGEKNFFALPFGMNSLDGEKIWLKDNFKDKCPDNLEVIIACGFFWKAAEKKRDEMKKFIENMVSSNNWKVDIYTQDKTLKKEFNTSHSLKVHTIYHRIDIHYIIVKNPGSSNKYWVYLELPHSENFFFRLETWAYLENEKESPFDCDVKTLLDFLEDERKSHFFKRSIPSFFNRAIKRKNK